jgi:undecaprenyl-diphosphatase
MDFRLFEQINGLGGHYAWLDNVMLASARGMPFVFAICLVALWLTGSHRQQVGAFLAGLSGISALGVGQIIIRLFPRPRPYDVHPAHLLVDRTTDPSFPSDHATLAFAIAVTVFRFNRRFGVILFFLAGLQCFARIYVGVHYPTDVFGGAILGTLMSVLVWRVSMPPRCRALIAQLFALFHKYRLAARIETD